LRASGRIACWSEDAWILSAPSFGCAALTGMERTFIDAVSSPCMQCPAILEGARGAAQSAGSALHFPRGERAKWVQKETASWAMCDEGGLADARLPTSLGRPPSLGEVLRRSRGPCRCECHPTVRPHRTTCRQ
jgi:hypothetical protein